MIDAAGQIHVSARREARIVSLVPSLTQLQFDLDLGTQMVGRTRFCVCPDAAAGLPSLGGHLSGRGLSRRRGRCPAGGRRQRRRHRVMHTRAGN